MILLVLNHTMKKQLLFLLFFSICICQVLIVRLNDICIYEVFELKMPRQFSKFTSKGSASQVNGS